MSKYVAKAAAVRFPLNVYVTSSTCVPSSVAMVSLSPDEIDPISESVITKKASVSDVPVACKSGLLS